MRHIAAAALLAAPLLLAAPRTALAGPGSCTYGYGCGGLCLNLFPHIHQHGPLFNYGPYYGYPPFEPYGYWNPYLQYTGPVGPQGGGGCCHGLHKWGQGNPHPLCGTGLLGHGGGGTCGGLHGVLGGGLGGGGHVVGHHGCSTCGHAGKCHSCGSVAAADATSGSVFDRYAGYGAPSYSAAYYVGTPGLTDPAAVMPAGYTGR
jgi:hypothetical protein